MILVTETIKSRIVFLENPLKEEWFASRKSVRRTINPIPPSIPVVAWEHGQQEKDDRPVTTQVWRDVITVSAWLAKSLQQRPGGGGGGYSHICSV